jgi:hypothetical protein
MNPVSDACKKGFLSLGGYTQHRNTKHVPASKIFHAAQYPHIPEMPSTQAGVSSDSQENHEVPECTYFTKHPVLNGEYYSLQKHTFQVTLM